MPENILHHIPTERVANLFQTISSKLFKNMISHLSLSACAFSKILPKYNKAKIHATNIKKYCLAEKEFVSVTLGYVFVFLWLWIQGKTCSAPSPSKYVLDQYISTMLSPHSCWILFKQGSAVSTVHLKRVAVLEIYQVHKLPTVKCWWQQQQKIPSKESKSVIICCSFCDL